MFGYIHPFRPELKCKDLDLYKGTYCGLCCTLRQRYGVLAPMFLSYDLTFLALLLEKNQDCYHPTTGRCHGNPFRKKACAPSSEALNRCADMTVLLAWFQLQDTIADDGLGKKFFARVLCLFLRPSYRKAETHLADFSQNTQNALARLAQLEEECCPSMDQVADCFASILRDAAPKDLSPDSRRCLEQILYHVGRWIYLIDACDDFQRDKKTKSFNPLRYRYGEEIETEALDMTLNHSIYMANSALDFLDFGVRKAVIENILQYGLPAVQDAVIHGRWQAEKKQRSYRQ